MPKVRDWIDHRIGYRKLVSALLIEEIPGGARWRYAWGSCLAIVFGIQLLTGLLLVTAYSPGANTAWASVFFIQYQMDFGWLIRGVHHFSSQAMVVLMAVHMLQVVIAGAHLAPREGNWWLGLGLLGAVLGLSLTGYLLPWDQKGYWATKVATNIMGNVPVVGPMMQRILVGGPEYGHHTLSRFYTLHVVILPATVIVLLVAHIALFRRHGVTTPKNVQGQGWFWPDQAFKDTALGLAVLVILLVVVVMGHGHSIEGAGDAVAAGGDATVEQSFWERVAHAGRSGMGANLDAPADPGRAYPARPEWYFLSLFQMLKYFEGEQEIIGTVYIPLGIFVTLFIMPLLGYGWLRKFGHAVGVLIIVGLIGAAGTLTYEAMAEDQDNEDFQKELAYAQVTGRRAIELADQGIPPAGPSRLLDRDPMTRGESLFGQHCASCHNHGDTFTDGEKASDLKGFGTEAWILGLLRDPGDPKYFGHTELTKMDEWADLVLTDLDAESEAQLKQIAKWLSEHPTPTSPNAGTEAFKEGLRLFNKVFECTDCHDFGEIESKKRGPSFTGYGSADWIRGMIMAPDHRSRYGRTNGMPAFVDFEGPDGEILRDQFGEREVEFMQLGAVERELIIRWLTQDDRPVYGGEPISSPPQASE